MQTIKERAEYYLRVGFMPPDRQNVITFATIAFVAIACCTVVFGVGYFLGKDAVEREYDNIASHLERIHTVNRTNSGI